MKTIVLLLLISNICLAQDILVPRRIVEACRENYDMISSLKSLIVTKDSVISNREQYIKKDSIHINILQSDSAQLQYISMKKDTIIDNKNVEIHTLNGRNRKLVAGGIGFIILEILLIIIIL